VRRLIVDASALLAGVAGRSEGTPALVLSALIESRFEAVVCPHLLNEVT
jgi:predicted nucleic acid-binding protein